MIDVIMVYFGKPKLSHTITVGNVGIHPEFNFFIITDYPNEWWDIVGNTAKIVEMGRYTLCNKLLDAGILSLESYKKLKEIKDDNIKNLICGLKPFWRDLLKNERDINGEPITLNNNYWGWIDSDILVGDLRNLPSMFEGNDLIYFEHLNCGQFCALKSDIDLRVCKNLLNRWIALFGETYAWDDRKNNGSFFEFMKKNFIVKKCLGARRIKLNWRIKKIDLRNRRLSLVYRNINRNIKLKLIYNGNQIYTNDGIFLFVNYEDLIKKDLVERFIKKHSV